MSSDARTVDPVTAGAAEAGRTVRGAGVLTAASIVVGLGNYGYALVVARLLAPELFGSFAAAQGLVLMCGTVATASMPWVVAHVLAGRPGRERRREVVWFSLVTNAAQGAVAAAAVLAVTAAFLDPAEGAWAAAAAFAVFLLTTPAGAFQGDQRFGALAALRVAEVILKIAFGAAAVALGLGVGGALAGAALGAAVVAVAGLVAVRADVRVRRGALRTPALWRAGLAVAGVQGLVAALAGLDVVLVGVLDADPVSAGSYQAASVLGRVPLFLGGALAAAAYPAMVRGGAAARTAVVAALRTYLVLAGTVVVALCTAPAPVLHRIFPPEYGDLARFLPYAAAVGALAGAVNLLSSWYQATGRFRPALRRQAVALAAGAAALVTGFALHGLPGLAVAAPVGPALTAALLVAGLREVRLPRAALTHDLAPVAGFALLAVLARPWPVAWLAVTAAAGLLALRRLRPTRVRPPRDRPRVLHLAFEDPRRPGSGGGAYRSWEVNRRLADEFDVVMVTTTWRGARDYTADGVRVVHAGLPGGYLVEVVTYFLMLPLMVRRHHADLVVEDFAAPISSALVPLYCRRVPVLAVVQWLNAREKRRQYHLPVDRFEHAGLRLHRRFVVVSEGIGERVRAGARPDAEVVVVPNGVEPAAFAVREPRGNDVVFLGRLELEQKGLDLLVAAWAPAAERLPGSRLVVAGAGRGERILRREAERLGVADRVELVGPVAGADRLRLLARARTVAMPSRFETFGLVAAEALACATPVVAFDIPCLREVVTRPGGVLVPAFDIDAFAAALVDSAGAADEEIERRGRAGRESARRFSWDTVADRQRQVYRAVLHEHLEEVAR